MKVLFTTIDETVLHVEVDDADAVDILEGGVLSILGSNGEDILLAPGWWRTAIIRP